MKVLLPPPAPTSSPSQISFSFRFLQAGFLSIALSSINLNIVILSAKAPLLKRLQGIQPRNDTACITLKHHLEPRLHAAYPIMSTNGTNGTSAPLPPDLQSFILLGPSGQDDITIPVSAVNQLWKTASSQAINYGSQIGACFIMLIVLLVMTPKVRFRRLPTIIYTLALTLNMIRMVLLSLFFPSTWLEFYTVMSGDVQFVAQRDYNISIAATVLGIPVTILVLFALFLQAWSMLQLWPRVYKILATLVSVALVITTIGFDIAITVLQCLFILYNNTAVFEVWTRNTYLGLLTASITWFCFLFISRLVMHMWKTRSILPSLKGLTAMDVLVVTNGILMLVPAIFAAIQFARFFDFESGSLALTSVVVVLPLGTLVAQRLANPGWFTAPEPNATSSVGGASKQKLLSSGTPRSAAHDISFQGLGGGTWTSQVSSARRSIGNNEKGRVYHADNLEAELARIDDGDLERGVRMTHSIEHSLERIPVAGSPKSS